MRTVGLLVLVVAGCDPFVRLEAPPEAPIDPGDIGQTLDNTPTEPSIDTDVILPGETGDTNPPVTEALRSVAAGEDFTCAVWPDGVLRCWGRNEKGQAAGAAGTFNSVDAGRVHACGIKSDGTISCWGDAAGEKTNAPSGAWEQISCGANACCAVNEAGDAGCWGAGLTPPDDLVAVDEVAVGETFACALDALSSEVVCWGAGQAVLDAPAGSFLSISAGDGHICGLDTNRNVDCWGSSSSNQTDAPTGEFVRVAAGGNQGCAEDEGGQVTCWGASAAPPGNGYGLIGVGLRHGCGLRNGVLVCWGDDTWYQATPPMLTGVAQIAVGDDGHGCIVGTQGALTCFGPDNLGQASPPSGSFRRISAGVDHSCAVRNDGVASCWGSNDSGQLDVKQAEGQRYLDIASYSKRVCGVRLDGPVECWGLGYAAFPPLAGTHLRVDLGAFHGYALQVTGGAVVGSLVSWGGTGGGQRNTPAGVQFSDVATGPDYTCAVNEDAGVMCWGSNANNKATPPAGSFRTVTTGRDHACAVRTDGALACWGANTRGELTVPTGRFTEADAGDGFTCAVSEQGGLSCWGARKL